MNAARLFERIMKAAAVLLALLALSSPPAVAGEVDCDRCREFEASLATVAQEIGAFEIEIVSTWDAQAQVRGALAELDRTDAYWKRKQARLDERKDRVLADLSWAHNTPGKQLTTKEYEQLQEEVSSLRDRLDECITHLNSVYYQKKLLTERMAMLETRVEELEAHRAAAIELRTRLRQLFAACRTDCADHLQAPDDDPADAAPDEADRQPGAPVPVPTAPDQDPEDVGLDGGVPTPAEAARQADTALIDRQVEAALAASVAMQDAVNACDEAAYRAARDEFERYDSDALRAGLEAWEVERLKPDLEVADRELAALRQGLPDYPADCVTVFVYYPEFEFVIDQAGVMAREMRWAFLVCETDVYERSLAVAQAIPEALPAMRAAAAAQAAKGAAPGTPEYDANLKASPLAGLIAALDGFIAADAFRLPPNMIGTYPPGYCGLPDQVAFNRAQTPRPEDDKLFTPGIEAFRADRQAATAGRSAAPLPPSVRAAAIATGVDIPPYEALPGAR